MWKIFSLLIGLQISFSSIAQNDIEKENFRSMVEVFEKTFTPIVKKQLKKNLKLELYLNEEPYRLMMKAEADVKGRNAIIRLYGGLPRHEKMTLDGLTLILCHELGHHLAGPPIRRADQKWSSAEGQCDYWATHLCAKTLWVDQAYTPPIDMPEIVKQECEKNFTEPKDQSLCQRSMMASQSMIDVLKSLRRFPRRIDFEEHPPTPRVGSLVRDHPGLSCRFKTLIGGVLCPANMSCERQSQDLFSSGRPDCWLPANYRP